MPLLVVFLMLRLYDPIAQSVERRSNRLPDVLGSSPSWVASAWYHALETIYRERTTFGNNSQSGRYAGCSRQYGLTEKKNTPPGYSCRGVFNRTNPPRLSTMRTTAGLLISEERGQLYVVCHLPGQELQAD